MTAGLDLPVCPVVAWHRSHDPHIFSCGLPAGHDGDHGQEIRPGVWMNWTVTLGFDTAPPPNPADTPTPAAPEPEPFDRSREKFFTGVCVHPGCYGDLTGRSLDGADPYWWHDIDVLDNDHDADPGKR